MLRAGDNTTYTGSSAEPLSTPASVAHSELQPPQIRVRRSRTVRWLLMLIALTIAGLVIRVAALQGIIKPVRIVGGSMAEALIGEHYGLTCGDCGFPFACGLDYPPSNDTAICPNCGFEQAVQPKQLRRGERVLIDRFPFWYRQPKRWEIIALQTPGQPQTLAVKRVVALPGERLAIRHGDLFLDSGILRKSLEQLRQLAILVHDNHYRPTIDNSLPPRWQSDTPDSQWRARGDGFQFNPPASSQGDVAAADSHQQFDWLTYRHWRCTENPLPRSDESPVLDNDFYNAGLSRQLQNVVDLMLACRLEFSGRGSLAFRIHDGREVFVVEFSPDHGEIHLLRGDKHVISTRLPQPIAGREVIFELALCDQQVLVAIDRQIVIDQRYEPSTAPFRPTSRPLGIGALGLSLCIDRLQVFRDVYYLDPLCAGIAWSLEKPLPKDEFILLGDNAPISTDSRHWPNAAVSRKLMMGKVLKLSAGQRD
jgi:signal peptidase I